MDVVNLSPSLFAVSNKFGCSPIEDGLNASSFQTLKFSKISCLSLTCDLMVLRQGHFSKDKPNQVLGVQLVMKVFCLLLTHNTTKVIQDVVQQIFIRAQSYQSDSGAPAAMTIFQKLPNPVRHKLLP